MGASVVLESREPRVLLALDDRDLRRVVRGMFQGLGAAVVEASSARRARERLEAARFELAALDLWIGHGEGLLLLEQIRFGWPELPVLLVGVEPRQRVLARARELGALGPVPAYELERAVPIVERIFELRGG